VSSADRSESIEELVKALVAAQARMTHAAKNAKNDHLKSRYADLASVWDAIREALTANGLCVVQRPRTDGRAIVLRTELLHVSGQWMASELPILVAEGRESDPRVIGSALTYARRYSLSAIAGIAQDDDDDDGNAAGAAPSAAARADRGGRRRAHREDGPRGDPASGPDARAGWDEWVGRTAREAADYWGAEMAMAKIPRERRKPLPNAHAIANHLSNVAIQKGLWTPQDVRSPNQGGELVHDRAKAARLVSGLHARSPRKIEEHVLGYLRDAEVALRRELGMDPLPDGGAPEPAMAGAALGREPGEDG
jgi:hypothetical protein